MSAKDISARQQTSPLTLAVPVAKRNLSLIHISFEGGPHDALPTDVWDPGEDLIPFGGEGSQALQERMVSTLANLMSADDVETVLAVSHGSASRQFIKAAAPEGFELPAKLPNCAIMIFDFEDSQEECDTSQCKFTLQQIIDPQQSL